MTVDGQPTHQKLIAKALALGAIFASFVPVYAGWFTNETASSSSDPVTSEKVKQVLMDNPEYVYDALVAYQKQQAEVKKNEIQKI